MADARITLGAVDNTRAAFESVKGNLQGLHTQATAVMGALGAVVSVAGLVAWVKATVDGVDALNDLKDATGSTIENISALEDIARRTGGSFETVSTSMLKFNGVLNNAKPGSDAELALKALNLNVKELKAMDPADALLKTATAMAGFADDGNKARLMQELFGKSTKDMAAFLKDLAEKGKLVATVTTEQADEAEKFNKELANMGKNVSDASRALVGPLVTSINEVIKKFKEGREARKGFFEIASEQYWSNVGEQKKMLAGNTGGATGTWNGGATGTWGSPVAEPAKPSVGNVKTAAEIAEELLKRKKALADQNKELSEQAKLLAELAGLSGSFAEDWTRLNTIYKAGKLSLEGLTKAQAELLAKQPAMKAANDAEAKAAALAQKAFEDADKARLDYNKSVADGLDKLQADTSALEGRNARLGLGALAIAELDAAELELQATKLDGLAIDRLVQYQDTVNYEMLKLQAEEKRKLATLTREGAGKSVAVEEAKAAASEWEKTSDDIGRGLTDSLFRAFESGKGFFSTLWSGIKNLFKTTVLKMVINPVSTAVSGAVGSALGLPGAASAQTGSAGGGAGDMLSAGKGVYDAITGGFAKLGASVSSQFSSFAVSSAGQSMGLSTTVEAMGPAIEGGLAPTMNVMTESASSMASAAGSFAASAGGVVAGVMLGRTIAGDKIVLGMNGTTTSAIGAAIGLAVGGPLGAVIGGVIGGTVNRAFGMGAKKMTDEGLVGTLGTDGADVQNFASWRKKGGWFRSDKTGTDYSAVNSDLQKYLDYSVVAIGSSTKAYAEAIGLSASTVAGFTQSINLSLAGLDGAGQKKAIDSALSGFGDAMAERFGLASLAKDGETASAALARLATSLVSVNAVLDTLDHALLATSVAGADAASRLIDAFGTADTFAQVTAAYFDTFYSEGERLAKSQSNLTRSFRALGMALPTNNDELRAMVSALDLNTDAGRTAYAALLKLAPQFAQTTQGLAKLAQDTADTLLKAFTGNGQLTPALEAAQLNVDNVTRSLTLIDALPVGTSMEEVNQYLDSLDNAPLVTAFQQINKVLGDSASGVITFATATASLSEQQTAAQSSAALLTDQIVTLKDNADAAKINFAGLAGALAGVDTATFVSTIGLVFKNLAERIQGVIGDITAERVAVREAALQIINPTVMSREAISRGIAAQAVTLPGNAAVLAASADLIGKDRIYAAATAASTDAATIGKAAVSGAQSALDGSIAKYQALASQFQNGAAGYEVGVGNAYGYNASTNQLNAFDGTTTDQTSTGRAYRHFLSDSQRFKDAFGEIADVLKGGNAVLVAQKTAVDTAQAASALLIAGTEQGVAAALAGVKAAENKFKAEAASYASAMQGFAIDASKAVGKLGRLREETVKYYEAQKALSDLMANSAAGLRGTVADYKYSQKTPAEQLAELQGKFSTAFSTAMSVQLDGTALAGQGDKLSGLLNPLIEKLKETGNSGLIAAYLAQAETVATLLEKTAPKDYAADSLSLLGSIDTTLAALDASSKSAELIISEAVKAGSEKTAAGLSAVIAAITGNPIPAFASGGAYQGGMALVGEEGPELINFDQPGQVYTASQTRNMLAGGGQQAGNAEVVAELRALRRDNANMRAELQAIAANTGKVARLQDKWDHDGLPASADDAVLTY